MTTMLESVAIFAPFPYYGGLQEFAIELSCRLHIPLILVGDYSSMPREINSRLVNNNIEVHWMPIEGVFLRNPFIIRPSLYRKLNNIMKQYKLIHFHGPFPIVGDLSLTGINFLFTYHFDVALKNKIGQVIANSYNQTLLLRTLKMAKTITVSSKFFAQESFLLRRFIYKIQNLPLGVDTTELIPNYSYAKKIVFIGRIIPEKGIHTLIRAFEIFSKKNPDYNLVIIGKPVDIKYWRFLLNFIKRLDINDKIILTGYLPRNKMIRVLSESSVLVLPSLTRLDSFGIVILEASALAIPVIATSVISGAREFIEKANNGLIVPPNNPVELAYAMEKIVENPKKYGIKGREFVVKHHNWDAIALRAHQILKYTMEH